MKRMSETIFGHRIWALIMKELHQMRRNRRLVIMLIIPPTVNLVLFGFALNPEVSNLRLGVVDESHSYESRELLSAFTESRTFQITGHYSSSDALGRALSAGELDAGLVIPVDFARQRIRHETAEVQFLVDAVDSNTATIAAGYAARIVGALSQRLAEPDLARIRARSVAASSSTQPVAAAPVSPGAQDATGEMPPPTPAPPVNPDPAAGPVGLGPASVTARVALLYNPGLRNSWFIVTGLMGALLILQGSLVAAASLVREKEMGTVEQLLMTPAGASEIITAKVAPIFLLMMANIGLSTTVGHLVFDVPVRGSLALLFGAGALCILAGIGIGTFIATFTHSQQQAQLMGFFVNPPVVMLSGAMTPIEAMPEWLQPVTYLNPVRHFAAVARGVMLKDVGVDVLYPNLFALVLIAVILMGISAWRFRKQLG